MFFLCALFFLTFFLYPTQYVYWYLFFLLLSNIYPITTYICIYIYTCYIYTYQNIYPINCTTFAARHLQLQPTKINQPNIIIKYQQQQSTTTIDTTTDTSSTTTTTTTSTKNVFRYWRKRIGTWSYLMAWKRQVIGLHCTLWP